MSKVENAVIWFTDDFSSRIGVRLWDEVEGHLEIVYEEFDSEEGLWKEISTVTAIDTETFTKITELVNSYWTFKQKTLNKIMKHTFASSILYQLKDSGFTIHKDLKENQWGIYDGAVDNSNSLLLRSRSLGDLMKLASKEFGLK